MGTFADWQPRYAEAGLATFPVVVDGPSKKPAVSNYLKIGQPASKQFAIKFGEFDAFGFGVDRGATKITVLDVDTTDERIFADALGRHGETPVIVRSGRGHHQAWYRHNGERRDTVTWRKRGLPIDVLGGGFVVAPPSRGSYGPYEFIQGGLADVRQLPVMKGLRAPPLAPQAILQARQQLERVGRVEAEGFRNNELWRQCMVMARDCEGPGRLLAMARVQNAKFAAPLDDWEVEKVVDSAWRYEERGLNYVSDAPASMVAVVPLSYGDIDDLMTKSPDAFVLLAWLRRHNFERDQFFVANAMHANMPGGRWTIARLRAARELLLAERKIALVRSASKATGAALYRWVLNIDHQ